MPYNINWTKSCVEWKYFGFLTGKEILESNNAIYGDERFDELKYQIVDLSGVDFFDVSEHDMQHMAALDKAAAKSNPNVRVAVIAPIGKAQEVANAYTKYSQVSTWESASFETREEAINWLGL